MSNTTTPSLSAVKDALALRTVSSSTVGDSAGPQLRIDLPNMEVGIVVERENWKRQTRTGLSLLLAPGGGAVFDWQLRLADGGQVCAGSIAAQCADSMADRVAAMASRPRGYFEEWDVCWYMHLLAAGVLDAQYEHTGGGCHNVTIALPHDYWLIFGSEGGEGGVGWSLSFDSDGSVADDYHVGPMDAFAVLVGELVRLFPQLDPRRLAVDTRVHRAGDPLDQGALQSPLVTFTSTAVRVEARITWDTGGVEVLPLAAFDPMVARAVGQAHPSAEPSCGRV